MANPLAGLSEDEAVGHVLVSTRGRVVRYRVHSFQPKMLRAPWACAHASTIHTGRPGNSFVVLERMAPGVLSQPVGSRVCWAKSYLDQCTYALLNDAACPECGKLPEGTEDGVTFCPDGHFFEPRALIDRSGRATGQA
jgi:hypothetical protein